MEEESRERKIAAMVENLPVLRAKLDLSQKELGKRIGVTRQQIANYENRKRPLTWTSFLALISVFSNNPESRKMIRMLNIWDGEREDERITDEDLMAATGGISQMAGRCCGTGLYKNHRLKQENGQFAELVSRQQLDEAGGYRCCCNYIKNK